LFLLHFITYKSFFPVSKILIIFNIRLETKNKEKWKISNDQKPLIFLTVPVFLSDRTELVKVEVQIRTIAMDFWASLEHELTYKLTGRKTKAVLKELKECADVIAETDSRMQRLYDNIVEH
jgi:hypothetical protein